MTLSRFADVRTLFIDFLKPEEVTFDTPGGGFGGGRNGLGEEITINLTGGPTVIADISNCFIHAPEQWEYISFLRAYLNSGVRGINVPLLTDWFGPFPIIDGSPRPMLSGIPHSDGSPFSDGAGYSQATVWGKVMEAANQNAGILHMRVYNASRRFRWSDWFSIYHTVKGWRAYSYWDVIENLPDGVEDISGVAVNYQEYRLALDIPLREPVPAGTRVEIARPLCVMKLSAGSSLPTKIRGFYQGSLNLQFTEAF